MSVRFGGLARFPLVVLVAAAWSIVLTPNVLVAKAEQGQRPATSGTPAASAPADPFPGLKFRNIGPATMGGRVDDLAVLESNPAVFYVGMASGGLWRGWTSCNQWAGELCWA